MKIGILGGSFNPIHTGHAILANYITQHTDIEQLWLMVSPQNPLKDNLAQSYDVHRLAMAELVARKCDNVITSGFEFTLPRPSYTIDTLRALKEKFPQHEFVLIIGADNWNVFNRWKNHDEILKSHKIMIYPRQGFDIDIPVELAGSVTKLSSPIIELSSTYIREQLKNSMNMNFYLPQDVYKYILEHKLYR
ncbi:MAG: nicotinate-nucleotide adenylyltransferase [Muribaculaceae bacterium]|nr:nicotinate-nucleotide adenylyltransferase [Muribaculaceae bacterium]MEE1297525.1 nicotinate (nicotinamide) nucleotide adenylyltransferase [Muribaculaceae bacterium]